VIATRVTVNSWRATKLTGNDEQDILVQTALNGVLYECSHGPVNLWPEPLHGLLNLAVHVPTAKRYGHKSATRFAQAAGLQQHFTQSGTVLINYFGVFVLKVKCPLGTPENQIKGLFFKPA